MGLFLCARHPGGFEPTGGANAQWTFACRTIQARVRNVNFKVLLANGFFRRYYGQTDFGNRAFSSAGEHYLHTVGVTGSNPVTPTTNYKPGKPGFFHARS